jgi:hypothetical protein
MHNSGLLKRKAFDEIKSSFPETPLNESLMNKPDNLNEIVEASRERQKILEESKRKYQSKLQKFNKE